MGFAQYYRQTATLWRRGDGDGMGGYLYSRETIRCRWEQKMVEVVDAKGADVFAKAQIFIGVDIKVGDWLALGSVLSTAPQNSVGAYEVRSISQIPTISGAVSERRAYVS